MHVFLKLRASLPLCIPQAPTPISYDPMTTRPTGTWGLSPFLGFCCLIPDVSDLGLHPQESQILPDSLSFSTSMCSLIFSRCVRDAFGFRLICLCSQCFLGLYGGEEVMKLRSVGVPWKFLSGSLNIFFIYVYNCVLLSVHNVNLLSCSVL